jgi:hypothetical protein
MTVIRHTEGSFDVPLEMVAEGVRLVLAKRPPYRNTSEVEKNTLFKTNIKPSWWLLGTSLTVELQSVSGGTKVIAKTKSQIFIFGDVYDYYNGYLRDFLEDLRAQIVSTK